MQQTAMARQGYSTNATVTRSTRRAEADVFHRAAQRLVAARAEPFGAMAGALTENRRLWTELAIDVADDGNALPGPLRAQLVGLAAFVERHTDAVLLGRAGIDPLVTLNRRMHDGLSGGAG